MELTPYLTHIKEIRKVMADTGLSLMPWDHEWDEFAAFGPKGANLTAQNIRGALKRMGARQRLRNQHPGPCAPTSL